MAAYAQIYDIETPLEEGFKWLLVDAGLTVRMPATYVNDDQESSDSQSEENKTGTVSIQVVMAGNIDHARFGQVTGQNVDDTYSGVLTVNVITDRNNNSASHRDLIASVRSALMTMDIAAFNTARDYHNILSVQEGQSGHEQDDENGLDLTSLTFNFIVQVKDDAWPTP